MIEYEVIQTDTPRWQECKQDPNWRVKRWRWTLFGHEESVVVRLHIGPTDWVVRLPANWETAT